MAAARQVLDLSGHQHRCAQILSIQREQRAIYTSGEEAMDLVDALIVFGFGMANLTVISYAMFRLAITGLYS